MTTATVSPKAPALEAVPFTLLQHGRATRRAKSWLLSQWRTTIIPRLKHNELGNPQCADFIFEDIYTAHNATRDLLGGDCRTWTLNQEDISALATPCTLALCGSGNLPSPYHLVECLKLLKEGNPSPAIDTEIANIVEIYGEPLSRKPEDLLTIPDFIINNRLGKASLLSFIESNPALIKIPETGEQAIRNIYLALLIDFLKNTLGNSKKSIADLEKTFDRHKSLKLRLTIEPHAFAMLGHMKGVDDSACFAAGGSNSKYAILLGAQPESVVCQLGYTDSARTFHPISRGWGRLQENGIGLSNFYPKTTHFIPAILACLLAASKQTPSTVQIRRHLHTPTKNASDDTILWVPKGYSRTPLYHNGDAFWWPLPPDTTAAPKIEGRVPGSYSTAPWAHPFSFDRYTE